MNVVDANQNLAFLYVFRYHSAVLSLDSYVILDLTYIKTQIGMTFSHRFTFFIDILQLIL